MTGTASPTIPRPVSRPAPAPPGRGRLRWRVVPHLQASEQLMRQWDHLAEETGGGIFMSRDWCRTWWDHYGTGRQARVFHFQVDDEHVGVLPMFTDLLKLGPLSLRVAKLMGSESTQGLCAIPVRPEWSREALSNAVEHLILRDRCDAIHLGPISGEVNHAETVREVCRRRGELVLLHRDRLITQNSVVARHSGRLFTPSARSPQPRDRAPRTGGAMTSSAPGSAPPAARRRASAARTAAFSDPAMTPVIVASWASFLSWRCLSAAWAASIRDRTCEAISFGGR